MCLQRAHREVRWDRCATKKQKKTPTNKNQKKNAGGGVLIVRVQVGEKKSPRETTGLGVMYMDWLRQASCGRVVDKSG